MRHDLPMRAWALLLLAVAPLACGGDKNGESRVLGSEGRERWVVTFDGAAPDLAEYRKLLADDPSAVPAYVVKMRDRQAQAHPELEESLTALGGRVVDRWWMSNQVTIELPATGVASVQTVPGVKAMVPDALLAP
jgi:hypothetical protein